MPVTIATPTYDVVISDDVLSMLTTLLAADPRIFSKVQQIYRSDALYVQGKTNGWWKFKASAPFWTSVADPTVPVTPPASVADILDLDIISDAQLQAVINRSPNQAAPSPNYYDPEFIRDPVNGMKVLRSCVTPTAPRDFKWWFSYPDRTSAYAQFTTTIETDVADGMTEKGVKFAGLSNDWSAYGGPQPYECSWVFEHSPCISRQPDIYPIVLYGYDITGAQQIVRTGATVTAGRPTTYDLFVQLNTPGKADGILRAWLTPQGGPRTLVYEDTAKVFRDSLAITLRNVQDQIYHGGLGVPSAKIHYRHGRVRISSTMIPVPPEMAAPYVDPTPPTGNWRAGLPLNSFSAIPFTSSLNGQAFLGNGSSAGANTVDAWSGPGADAHGWILAASSGHDANNGNGWENKVISIGLDANAPRWALRHPGSPYGAIQPLAHYKDGLPCSRHCYYTPHVITFPDGVKRLCLFTIYGSYSIGFPDDQTDWTCCDALRLDTMQWEPAGFIPNLPANLKSGVSSVCKDFATGNVYVAQVDIYWRWLCASNSWENLGDRIWQANGGFIRGSWEFHPSLIDNKRNRWTHFNERGEFVHVDLATMKATIQPLTGSLLAKDHAPLVHDLDNDAYWTLIDSTVYRINPDAATWSSVATVPSALNGCHNRFAYFKELGGIAYLPQYASDILFMPTRAVA